MKIAKENIIFALSVKIAIMIITLIGISNMWLAVFADVGVAVLAILNSMRTLLVKKNAKYEQTFTIGEGWFLQKEELKSLPLGGKVPSLRGG